MQDAILSKSSSDASDSGAPRFEDFSNFKQLNLFSKHVKRAPIAVRASIQIGLSDSESEFAFAFEISDVGSSAGSGVLSHEGSVNGASAGSGTRLRESLIGDAKTNLRAPAELSASSFASVVLPDLKQQAERQPRDELWKATCFEFFIGRVGSRGYLEFNFSPTGDFAVYAFDDYRDGMRSLFVFKLPQILVERFEGRYRVSGRLTLRSDAFGLDRVLLDVLRAKAEGAELEASITAILRGISPAGSAEADGTTYWALAHDGEKPDFHLRSSFLLEIAPTSPIRGNH